MFRGTRRFISVLAIIGLVLSTGGTSLIKNDWLRMAYQNAACTYTGGSFGIITDNFDEAKPVSFYFDNLQVGTVK